MNKSIPLLQYCSETSRLPTTLTELHLFALQVQSGFVVPCLEEVVITIRSPLNAEQKISTLESLLKSGKVIKSMAIRILQMRSSHSSADDFFDEICRFQRMNHKIVRIE